MSKKKWLLVFLCILLLAGYWKFFYKTYSENSVAKSADCILALDVKRVTNTVIWNIFTSPGQWKKISYSASGKISWKDMVKMPDYVFIFHSSNQPANAWYTVLEIKNEINFINGLLFYHFEKGDSLPGLQTFFSSEQGIEIIKSGNKILVGNNAVQNKSFIWQVAKEMFIQKQFVERKKLSGNVEAGSHLSIVIEKNNFLREDAIVKINFDKKKIAINAMLPFQKQFDFTEANFKYASDALCSSGFTQPSLSLYAQVPLETKAKISKAINFNIDSLLLQSNHSYDLNVPAIVPGIDSAISYVYDDNFNQVEKVVANNVMQPVFNFRVNGERISKIYNYWNNNGQIEETATGVLFLPMPFVKSYCNKVNETQLSITSNGFQNTSKIDSINCVFFFRLLLTKIPAELLNYLPGGLVKSIANLETIKVTLKKTEGNLILDGTIEKKDNDLPIINL